MNIQLTTADLQEKEGLLTEAIQEKIDELHQQGGGRITFSAGRYPTGALFLKSNIELHLLLGATLVFSDDPKDYPVVVSLGRGQTGSLCLLFICRECGKYRCHRIRNA